MIVNVKPGVQFTVIAPAGFHILSCIQLIAEGRPFDLTITSACDGEHSGPNDPHHRGEAYDVRCHDLSYPAQVLHDLQQLLGAKFYAFIEDPDTDNTHIHVQLAKGEVYP